MPILIENLKILDKLYLDISYKIEESGEILFLGKGELISDFGLQILRNILLDKKVDVRITDPSVLICETINTTS